MHSKRPRRVTFRDVLLLLLLAVILPSLCVEFGLHYYWYESRKQAEAQADLALSRSVAATFDSYIRDLDQHEYALAETMEFLKSPTRSELDRLLKTHATHYPALGELMIIDSSGTVVASSSPRGAGARLAQAGMITSSPASRQAVVSDMFQQDGQSVFIVSRDVIRPQSHPRLIIAAIVVTDRLAEANLAMNDGEEGELIIFDHKGHEVYEYPVHNLTWAQRAAPESGDTLAEALQKHEAVGTVREADEDEDRLVARVPIADIGWAAGAGHPQRLVMGPLTRRMLVADGLELAAAAVSIVIAILISRRITGGIARLRKQADAIGRGERQARDDTSSVVELAELNTAFRHMAASRGQIDALQRQLAIDREHQAAFLRRLLDNAPIGIAVINPRDGRYIMANPAYTSVPGRPIEDLVGHSVGDFVPPETAAFMRWILKNVVETGQPFRVRGYEAAVGPGREHTFWDNDVVPLLDEKGRVENVLALTQEVTEQVMARKRIEELAAKLRATNEALEERVAARTTELEWRSRQLQALVSELTDVETRERRRLAELLHDRLQQLLVGAKLNLWAMKTRDKTLQDSIAQVDGLLNDAIQEARLLTVELSPPILYQAPMPGVLRWLARWMQEKHGLNVTLEMDEQADPQAQDARVLLFQSVRELLFNIVKHANVKAAHVALSRHDNQVQVVVSDEGVGFDPRPALNDSTMQSGFGIFSIHERLNAMGGHLDIDSAPGRGTHVAVRVPLSQSPSVAAATPVPAPQTPTERYLPVAVQPVAKPGSIRVLLADDHDTVRQGLAGLMQAEPDINVVGQARDGLEAVELAQSLRPEIVVMDVTMPGLDGIEATRRIKAQFESTQIIGLSMHEEEDVAEQMRSAGAAEYLTKGGPSQSLLSAIRRLAAPSRPDAAA